MTGLLARAQYDKITLLFNDVLAEDADTYRFLIEGAAIILDQPVPDALGDVLLLPPLTSAENVERRRVMLAQIRERVMAALPGFVWLADGRTPWEAWRDARFIGNSRTAHCSAWLKARVGDAWVAQHAPHAALEYGMYFDEAHRILKLEAVKAQDIGRALHDSGLLHSDIAQVAARHGLSLPQQYADNFTHANCSGLCCRAGKEHWAQKFAQNREEALFMADVEAGLLADLPAARPMLKDRRGGDNKGIPLQAFFAELEADPLYARDLDQLDSGCGCMFDALVGGEA